MTVPASWREAFRAQEDLGKNLEREVRKHLRSAPRGWYTEVRVKEEESFNQKIETGSVPNFFELEDFVGALIVVPLPSDIPAALDFASNFFEVSYRRPKTDTWAERPAWDFRFNDVRLYGHLKHDDSLPGTPLESVIFEIQVKTFFQHAWSSATHDLVYKHPRFSWARSRVAAQVKAMLEQAELSIAAIDALDAEQSDHRDGDPESTLNGYLFVLESHWTDLPQNRKRMTETLATLCIAFALDAPALDDLLIRGRDDSGGHPDGWSPYQCVVDYLSRYKPDEFRKTVLDPPDSPGVIHVTNEVLERVGLSAADVGWVRL